MPQFFHHVKAAIPSLVERLPYSDHFASLSSSIRHPLHPSKATPKPAAAEKPVTRPARTRRFRHPNDLPSTLNDTGRAPSPRTSKSRFPRFPRSRLTVQTGNRTGNSELQSVWGLAAARRGLASMFSAADTLVPTEKTLTAQSQATTTIVYNNAQDEWDALPKGMSVPIELEEQVVPPRPKLKTTDIEPGSMGWD